MGCACLPSWSHPVYGSAISTHRHHGPRPGTRRPAAASAGARMGIGARGAARGRFVVCIGGIQLIRPSLSPCFEAHRAARAPFSGRKKSAIRTKKR